MESRSAGDQRPGIKLFFCIVFLKLGHDDRTLSPVGRANHVIVFKRRGILIYVAQEGRNEVCGIRDRAGNDGLKAGITEIRSVRDQQFLEG